MSNIKIQFKKQRMIDGWYNRYEEIMLSSWILSKNRERSSGRWSRESLSKQFFGYSANAHPSWHRAGNIQNNFVNILCKTPNEVTKEILAEERLISGKYRIIKVPTLTVNEQRDFQTILGKLENLSMRKFTKDYKLWEYSTIKSGATILSAFFAINDYGKLGIKIETGYKEHEDSLWNDVIQPNDGECIYEFVKRVYSSLIESTIPFIERADRISIYETAFLERTMRIQGDMHDEDK